MLSAALWLGGLMALFMFVQTLFAKSRPLAAEAAPVLFNVFERYQLVLAAIAILATIGWRILSRQWLIWIILGLLTLAMIGAIAGPLAITGPMEALRAQGLSGTADFRRLHGYSMIVYVGQTILLTGVAVILPMAIRREGTMASIAQTSARV
jgi:hypothetical protein